MQVRQLQHHGILPVDFANNPSTSAEMGPAGRNHYGQIKEQKNTNNARKSLLFTKGEAWKKKDNQGLFDVTIGSLDGAEV